MNRIYYYCLELIESESKGKIEEKLLCQSYHPSGPSLPTGPLSPSPSPQNIPVQPFHYLSTPSWLA